MKIRLLAVTVKTVQNPQAVFGGQFGTAGTQPGQVHIQLRADAGKEVFRLLVILPHDSNRDIHIPNHAAAIRRFFHQHGVVFFAQTVKFVMLHRYEDILLKIAPVELAGDDADFGIGVAVKGIKQLAITQKHGFLVLVIRCAIVNVGELPRLAEPVLTDEENAVFPKALYGDGILYAAWDAKFFLVLPAQIAQGFYHFALNLLRRRFPLPQASLSFCAICSFTTS